MWTTASCLLSSVREHNTWKQEKVGMPVTPTYRANGKTPKVLPPKRQIRKLQTQQQAMSRAADINRKHMPYPSYSLMNA